MFSCFYAHIIALAIFYSRMINKASLLLLILKVHICMHRTIKILGINHLFSVGKCLDIWQLPLVDFFMAFPKWRIIVHKLRSPSVSWILEYNVFNSRDVIFKTFLFQ